MAASNVYQIGVRMTMHDQVSTALAAIAGHFIHLGHHIGHATAQARRFQQAVAGAALAYGGQQLGKAMVETLKHGAELLRIQNQMAAGGWSQAEIARATAKAWELTSKYQSISVDKILEMQKEMAPVMGDRGLAMEKAEAMTKMQVAMQGILGHDKAAQFTKQIRDAIRAGELAGEAVNPERFKAYLDSMVKVLNAFGGTVTPTDFFMATKYGRASALNWSDEFRERILPTIIQELGASSTGTAFMSMYQAIIGGVIHKRYLENFYRLGLIDKDKINPADITPEGHVKKMSPGAITNSQTFMSNPYEWVHGTLIPAMLKAGDIRQEHLDAIRSGNIKEGIGIEARKLVTQQIALLFGNRTAQGMVDLLALQPGKIERDARLIQGAMGPDASVKLFQNKDYLLALEAFHKQWDNLLTALTHPNLEKATNALKSITSIITSIGQAFAADPGTAQTIGNALVSLVVGTVVAGLGILAAAVFGWVGLLAVGVISALTFVALTIAQNWEMLKAKFNDGTLWSFLGQKLAQGIQYIPLVYVTTQLAQRIGAALMQVPGMLAGAISAMASGIASAIGAAISGLANKLFGGMFKSPGGANPGMNATPEYQPQSFTPPARGTAPIQIRSEINMDGYRVAQAVTQHIVNDGSHVSGPATYDGVLAPTPVDLIET